MYAVSITINVVSLNPVQASSTRYNIMWSSSSVTCGRSVVFWPPRYNWNIVESGVKHQNPIPINCNVVFHLLSIHYYKFTGEFWAHRNSLTTPLFIEVHGKWVAKYLCVRGIAFDSFYDFSIGLKCSGNVVIFCFLFC